MWKTIIVSIQQALANSWNNLFHTFLSILGIVIGVAALVGILSLIDGLEKFANEQIASTTGLQMLIMQAQPYQTIDEVHVRLDDPAQLNYANYLQLSEHLPTGVDALMRTNENNILQLEGDTSLVGAVIQATTVPYSQEEPALLAGRDLEDIDIRDSNQVILLNFTLAQNLANGSEPASLLHQELRFDSSLFKVIGITVEDPKMDRPLARIPISAIQTKEWAERDNPIYFRAQTVEDVPIVKEQLEAIVSQVFPGKEDQLTITTNESRVEQAAQAFLLFRVIMGFIVGISVVVGGIGIMNVLLISVTERTREIGLRKAMGAKRKAIVLQFLAEAITISSLGSVIGLILGVLGTLIVVPIVKSITDAPFQAAFTLNTLLIVSLIAVLIGIIFGTYPAFRAAKLDPVEAIRRE